MGSRSTPCLSSNAFTARYATVWEWNRLSFTFHGDSTPRSFEAELARGVDVFMHEGFIDAVTFHEKTGIPLQYTKLIAGEHTTADNFGELMNIAQPSLGVAYHYFLDDDTVDAISILVWLD